MIMNIALDMSLPREDSLQGRTCLGTTCLKWTQDGELSEADLQLILDRLSRADAQLRRLERVFPTVSR